LLLFVLISIFAYLLFNLLCNHSFNLRWQKFCRNHCLSNLKNWSFSLKSLHVCCYLDNNYSHEDIDDFTDIMFEPYTHFQCYVRRQHLSTCHLLSCYINGWKTISLWNWQYFQLLVEEITNDNYWPQMVEEDCRLCEFPDLWDNSKYFSVVDQFSSMTFCRIGRSPLLIFGRCKHSKQLIYFSCNNFWYS